MSQPVRPPSQLIRPLTVPGRLALILRQWQEGEEPDAGAVLEQHPEWVADKPFVQDLVLEEFCLRADRGEKPSVEEYAARFPVYRSSIRRMLAAQLFIDENPSLLIHATPTRWPEPGERVGDLTLIRELGRGAFARVFLATEASTGNRTVVAKLSFDGQHEALTLGPLEHPGIVRVLSAGIDAPTGLSVVRMPYHGRATLEDLLDKAYRDNGATPLRSARIVLDLARDEDAPTLGTPFPEMERGSFEDGMLLIIRQMAEALAFLHARGVCHRDIKPTNVLLSPLGRPLLLDFNLSADGRLPPGRLGGTLPYMAPEQIRAMTDSRQPIPDAAADVYALGVIAHELLTGRHPFGPVPTAAPIKDLADLLIVRQHQGPASIREINRRVSRPLAALLARSLAVDPSVRPTATEFVEAIERHFSLPRRCGRWVARSPLIAAGIAAALVALSAGLVRLAKDAIPSVPAPVKSTAQVEALELYARGRDLLLRDDRESAYTAFRNSNSGYSDGKALACMAYLEAGNRSHHKAIRSGSDAIERGLKRARVFNNRGYSHLMVFEAARDARQAKEAADAYDAAMEDFAEAIRLDPQLQAPRYNRGRLALRKALANPKDAIPHEAFDDMRQAIALGPVTRALAVDAARLFALGMSNRPALREDTLKCLDQAVRMGQEPKALARDPLFRTLKDDAAFQKLLTATASLQQAPRELQLLDPLPESEPIAVR